MTAEEVWGGCERSTVRVVGQKSLRNHQKFRKKLLESTGAGERGMYVRLGWDVGWGRGLGGICE